MSEEWRDVVGYEGWYEVSNLGRVRRSRPGVRTRIGYVLHQTRNQDGYSTVHLSRLGVGRVRVVHALVAEAFLGPRQPGQHVNHLDGIKTNNIPANLEYATPLRNARHAIEIGLRGHGEHVHNAKLTDRDVVAIRASVETDMALSQRYGVSAATISHARSGRNWGHLAEDSQPNRGRGELRQDSKLTAEAVNAIRRSGESNGVLALRYGVSRAAIHGVKSGRTWKHLL